MRMTTDEIRLVAFVLIALVVGSAVSHWRKIQRDQGSHETGGQVPVQRAEK